MFCLSGYGVLMGMCACESGGRGLNTLCSTESKLIGADAPVGHLQSGEEGFKPQREGESC